MVPISALFKALWLWGICFPTNKFFHTFYLYRLFQDLRYFENKNSERPHNSTPKDGKKKKQYLVWIKSVNLSRKKLQNGLVSLESKIV